MSFNCHFGVTLSHLPVTRSSPNCVTRWRWPQKGQSWHLGTFETSKGGQVSSKRHNFIDEIFRQHFYLLKYQKLFSWEKNGSILEIFMVLKCISVWKIPGDWSTSTLESLISGLVDDFYFRDHETVDKDLYVVSNGAEVIIISGCSKIKALLYIK